MGLGSKLNLVLLFVFAFGLGLFYFLSEPFLEEQARQEVLTRARIMMQSAAGTRLYTAHQIAPLLRSETRKFYPQAVAAYAAMKNFDSLRTEMADYSYREPSLNPTNPSHRAIEWEADIINSFRAFPDKRELVTYRDTEQGRFVHLS